MNIAAVHMPNHRSGSSMWFERADLNFVAAVRTLAAFRGHADSKESEVGRSPTSFSLRGMNARNVRACISSPQIQNVHTEKTEEDGNRRSDRENEVSVYIDGHLMEENGR